MSNKISYTECCGYESGPVIYWNEFNNVTQCHNCGQVYEIAPKPSRKQHESSLPIESRKEDINRARANAGIHPKQGEVHKRRKNG